MKNKGKTIKIEISVLHAQSGCALHKSYCQIRTNVISEISSMHRDVLTYF